MERANGVAQYQESKIRDPRILQFIKRIAVEHEPKFEGNAGKYRVACRLVVCTTKGATYETTVLFRKGSPEDPMKREELAAKFRALVGRLDASRASSIAEVVLKIERCEDLSAVSKLLTVCREPLT